MIRQNKFNTKPNFTLYNRLNNEQIAGDLVNEDEIEGKQFYVMRVGTRLLKLAKDAYSPKKMFAHR
jgi:hypothetical protein